MHSEERQLISVIVPLKIGWEPVYYLPQGMQVTIGQRVRLVFSGKEYIAVVSNLPESSEIPQEKIQEILEVMSSLATISKEEIEFWREIADYYLCSVGEVYKVAYPLLKINQEEIRAKLAAREKQKREKTRLLLEKAIENFRKRAERKKELADKAKGVATKSRLLSELASIETAQAAAEEKLAKFLNACGNLEGDNTNGGNGFGTTDNANGGGGFGTTDYANGGGGCGTTDSTEFGKAAQLSPSQSRAYSEIKEALSNRKTVLLDGVTGSGKTEIYINLALEMLAQGKNVLYLVPEIALSRQLELRLGSFFKDSLYVFHSGESSTKRAAVIESIHKKNGYIILGTRSSLFLPHRNLGLIIVDEEQDSSYKQDSPAPRYNGRDCAAFLARIHNCPLLLGSATPSLESLYNCRNGRFTRVRLAERFHGSGDAEIEIIDTKAERRKRGMRGSISIKLAEALRACIDNGGQALILRARKSYSTFLQCNLCGSIVLCPHCKVSLSYSKSRSRMICHHCGYSLPYSGKCNKEGCKGELIQLGAGTEKIEEELQNLFPDYKVGRLDSDIANAEEQKSVINDFANGRIQILVGTQMVSKGFDFQGLNLVALIQADSLLGVSDFRADEKAVQLMEQFRGRCGRRDKAGRFIIQTASPDHPIYESLLSSVKRSAYEEKLLEERRGFAYPPFTRVVNLLIRDKNERRAERLAGNLALALRGEGAIGGETAAHGFVNSADKINIAGPFSPGISKIGEEHIRIIRISLPKDRKLAARKKALKKLVLDFCERQSCQNLISFDVDPI